MRPSSLRQGREKTKCFCLKLCQLQAASLWAPKPPYWDSANTHLLGPPTPCLVSRAAGGQGSEEGTCSFLFVLLSVTSHEGPAPSQQHSLQSPAPLDTNRSTASSSRQQLLLRGLVPSPWAPLTSYVRILSTSSFCFQPKEWQLFPGIYYLCATCLLLQPSSPCYTEVQC